MDTTLAIEVSEATRDLILKTELINPGVLAQLMKKYEIDARIRGDRRYFLPPHKRFANTDHYLDASWVIFREDVFIQRYSCRYPNLLRTEFTEVHIWPRSF